jgi:hypothetical protein
MDAVVESLLHVPPIFPESNTLSLAQKIIDPLAVIILGVGSELTIKETFMEVSLGGNVPLTTTLYSVEVSEIFAGAIISESEVAPEIFPPLVRLIVPFLH